MASNTHHPFYLPNILERLKNNDSDYRFMTLNDLLGYLTSANATGVTVDSFQNIRLVDEVLKTLDDVNGEVQNLAVKCIGPLVQKQKDSGVEHILRTLTSLFRHSKTDPSILSTALRNSVAALPRPDSAPSHAPPQGAPTIQGAQMAVANILIPELYNMLNPETEGPGVTVDTVELLIETLRCFGKILAPKDVESLQVHVMKLLEHQRTSPAVRKRAVIAVSLLCVYAPDILLSSYISHLIESLTTVHSLPARQRLLVSVTAALANAIPQRFAPYLAQLCPLILSIVNGNEDEEHDDERNSDEEDLKESALVALEAFQNNCTADMRKFTAETIDAGLTYLKYDPNFADAGSDDEEMGGTQEDEDDEFGDDDDFEQEDFSDEDDLSWKVRRCSAKLIATIINTRCKDLMDDGTLYNKIAPILVDRFSEREESVRLEILSTTTILIKRTGELAVTSFISKDAPVATKKRRRTSDAATEAQIPAPPRRSDSFPEQSLTKLVPKLTKAVAKLLRDPKTTVATKGATVTLLSAVVTALQGGLGDYMSQFITNLTEMAGGGSNLGSSSGSSGAASGIAANSGNVRIEVIRLLGRICKEHELRVLRPHIASIVAALVNATKDRYYKVSSEAINITNDVVVLLTDTSTTHNAEDSKLVQSIFDVILEKVKANDVDLEVRRRAVGALGTILSRTTIAKNDGVSLTTNQRQAGLDALLQRLNNETTILMAIKAIDKIVSSPISANILEAPWVTAVVNVLGLQLRKSNRNLRAASLETLKAFSENETAKSFFNTQARKDLLHVIVQLLSSLDIHLLSPALLVAKSIFEAGDIAVDSALVKAICQLVQNPLGGGLVETSLVSLIKVIGELPGDEGLRGKQALMSSLLQDIGVTGETQSVAKVIAQLLVSGGPVYIVGVDDFVGEASRTGDNRRKCLALMVLGECGLRMGKEFRVQPDVFLREFKSDSDDVPIAAAVALGLAAVGNLDTYLPVIMQRLGGNDKDQYLLLHSLKEIIQYSAESPENIKPVATDIWKALFAVAKDDDSKAVGAECLGRLTIINPQLFLEDLHGHLSSPDKSTRGMVISAFRFTFSDTPASYDDLLRPIVVKVLTIMLNDPELDNRKLALTSLNSAAHNKPHLVLPHLGSLLPLVYRESKIRPELVREVQMGPFKHKVDDGLDVRKSAYETLYALLDTSFPGVPIQPLFERVLAGLEDEHDIRVLCNLMIPRLITIARQDVLNRLGAIVEKFRQTLNQKLKDNAVKQELEKNAELVRSTLRTSAFIQKELGKESLITKTAWPQYWDWVKAQFAAEIKTLEGEDGGSAF